MGCKELTLRIKVGTYENGKVLYSILLTSTKTTLALVNGACHLKTGKLESQSITKQEALDLLESESKYRAHRTTVKLAECKDAHSIEYVLAVNFAYMRRITKMMERINSV